MKSFLGDANYWKPFFPSFFFLNTKAASAILCLTPDSIEYLSMYNHIVKSYVVKRALRFYCE